MKIIRSAKCSLKFSTAHKKQQLGTILSEYGKVVNIFIRAFWSLDKLLGKTDLIKDIVDIPMNDTWLSARLRKVAAREAIDMVLSVKAKKKGKKSIPIHKGERMNVSCTIAELNISDSAKEYDAWLHIASVGNKTILDLPINFHKQYHKWNVAGKRLNAYIITKNYVQFCFEIETGKKKDINTHIGIDSGINALASCSTGNQYGHDIKECVARVKRCKHGSNGQKTARRALRQRIDEITKQVINTENPDLIVVEQLKNLGHKTKAKRLLVKNIRRSIGIWNWRYWLTRLEQQCQINRISFRSVSPYNTSITCSDCGHADRMNRQSQECFCCQKCGHADNADLNASKNILSRFVTGKYGSGCKLENEDNLPVGNFVQV